MCTVACYARFVRQSGSSVAISSGRHLGPTIGSAAERFKVSAAALGVPLQTEIPSLKPHLAGMAGERARPTEPLDAEVRDAVCYGAGCLFWLTGRHDGQIQCLRSPVKGVSIEPPRDDLGVLR
jgi:hypothetical protein